MAKEVQFQDVTGGTDYFNVTNSVGQWWNTAGSAFEAFNASNWTDYDIAATEFGSSGHYAGDFPSAITAGVYNVAARRRAGGSPAQTDQVVANGRIEWSGSAVAPASPESVLVESGITPGAGLTNDAGTQLSGINMKQAVALILSANDGVLAGAASLNVTIKPGGKPAGNTRVDAVVDADGNRTSLTLKVPT